VTDHKDAGGPFRGFLDRPGVFDAACERLLDQAGNTGREELLGNPAVVRCGDGDADSIDTGGDETRAW
jgi:hypothetical protein